MLDVAALHMPPVPRGGARRLDQLLSQTGVCSRKDARFMVKAGRVTVKGQVAKSADDRVKPEDVLLDGEPLDHPDGLLVMINKPGGLVCSHELREGERLYDLLPEQWLRRNPVPTSIGRLDKDTTGIILVTDIMPLVHFLTSPKHGVDKEYLVEVEGGVLDEALVTLFASGTFLLSGESKPCLPATLVITGPQTASLTLQEGKFHQVKRMFEDVGLKVIRLHRRRFGPWTDEGLEVGAMKILPLP